MGSGLMYRVLRAGRGKLHPVRASLCTYHLRLQLVDGTEIQSTFKRGQPLVETLDGSTAGFYEALQLMVECDRWVLYIPSELAYGSSGNGAVPGDAALIFYVDLIEIHKRDDL